MTKNNFLIYGSYGYSGNLIAELACEKGLKPILAGRNAEKLAAQAKRLGLEYRVFDVNNQAAIQAGIQDVVAVIHCAGPFFKTYQNMVRACFETQTHYTDITGEFNVIERLAHLNDKAKAAKIMLLPGAGFDVVPSDCLAQYLKQQCPDATTLTLAIDARHGTKNATKVSRGTAKTMVAGLASNTMIREGGELKEVPSAWKTREFQFGDHRAICTTISWGDIASAWWSTHIPHIETYMSTPKKLAFFYKLIKPIKPLFRWPVITRFLENRINQLPEGPSQEELKNGSAYVYGEVHNENGEKCAAVLRTPNGYALTAITAVLIMQKILQNEAPVGFQTPSTAYGSELILEVPGVERQNLH